MMNNMWNYLRGKTSAASAAAADDDTSESHADISNALELLLSETSGQLLRNPTAPRLGRTYVSHRSASEASPSCVATLHGHEDRIWGLAWHPSGDLLVSCGGDKSAKLWIRRQLVGASNDAVASSYPYSWECIHTIRNEHAGTIRTAAWSADGNRLALCSFDGTISVWIVVLKKRDYNGDAENEEDDTARVDENEDEDEDEDDTTKSTKDIHIELEISLDGHESEVKGVAWFNDTYNYNFENDRQVANLKAQIAANSTDGASARLLAAASSRVLASATTMSAGGKQSSANNGTTKVINARRPLQLATCSRDRSVWVWEGRAKDEDTSHNNTVPGSQLLLPAERNVEYECAGVLTGHPQDIKSVAWVPSAVLVGGNNTGPFVVDSNAVDAEDDSIANSVTLSSLPPAGPSTSGAIVSCSYDDTVRVWEEHSVRKDDWDCVQTLAGHDGTVWEAAVQPNAEVLEVVSADGDASSSPLLSWKHALPTNALVVTASDDGRLVAWQRDGSNSKRNYVQVGSVGGFADGRTLYSVSWAPAVSVSSCATGDDNAPTTSAGALSSTFSVRVSDVVAVGTGDDSFAVFRVAPNTSAATGSSPISSSISFEKLALVPHAHDGEVNCVRFCPTTAGKNGTVELATASDDGDIKIWAMQL